MIICHGGPGATHDYVEPIAALSGSGRACVLYDQLGNGRSDHLPDADPSFWTVELFERELTALADHLGIAERYHVIGQSWGGMLALAARARAPARAGQRRGGRLARVDPRLRRAAATSCSTRWTPR